MTSKSKDLKDLRRLKRAELIEIIARYQNREKELLEKNRKLEAELNERNIRMSNVGSIAEASLAINGVFDAAQAAADQYLEEIKRILSELREGSNGAADGTAEEMTEEKDVGTGNGNGPASI